MKLVLAVENKLHHALFSTEAEHKVLQHLMDGLISITFIHEDLQCSFFRPALNLASPRFLNERMESPVLSHANKSKKGSTPTAQDASHHKQNDELGTNLDKVALKELLNIGVVESNMETLICFMHDFLWKIDSCMNIFIFDCWLLGIVNWC